MKNFTLDEFKCKCCGVQHMDGIFLAMLDNARDYASVPFKITSGYRCPKHNADVGSTSANHTSGKASDIECKDGPDRLKMVQGLFKAGFRRLGIGPSFIHADSMDSIESIWLYSK